MKDSVAVAKEVDKEKEFSPTKSSDSSIQRLRNGHEMQFGSLGGVIGNIRRDGGKPSVESMATQLSGMHTAQRAPALLALQQTHGNRYVQRVVSGIHAKLVVGQPGDVYEQEADRVADEVMRTAEPVTQRQAEEEKEEEELVQTKSIAEQNTPLAQRQIEEEEEEGLVQPKLVATAEYFVQRQVDEEEKEEEFLQTKELTGHNAEITPDLESRIQAIRGGGQLLPESTRALFEPRFGYDFSQVRVHLDSRAADVAEILNVRAFTTRQDIVFGAGQYTPRTEKGQRLLAHELTHVVQQRREIPSPLGYGARSDQGEIAYEVVPNNSLIQKEEGEPEGEEGAEIRQEQQEINVALYDQNPAHMHPDHRLHTELRSFRGWATDWAQDYSASSHAVRVHSDIHDALTGVIAQLPPDGRIETISCFGHGSSRSGWLGMGDIGDILLSPGIRNRLSPNLRVILYMCSAGASPRSTRTIEPGGEEPARGPGGVRSFAAGLRDRLAGAQLRNVEVWAHTIAGVAATSPHWRVFTDEGTPGEAFFRTVFDEIEVPIDFMQLSMRYRRLDEASRQSRSKEFPTSSADLCDRWMWRFYLNFVRGEEIATRIPMEPDQCLEEIWLNWRAYRDGDNRVLRPGRIWYDFLNTNDFEDLPHLR